LRDERPPAAPVPQQRGPELKAASYFATRPYYRGAKTWPRRIPGWLLDVAVGYGHLPLRAVGWTIGLLTLATVYFAPYRPARVQPDDTAPIPCAA